jgi:hypothetical protein
LQHLLNHKIENYLISEESGLSSNNNNDANGTANKKSAENGLPNKMDNNPIVQLPSTHQLEGSKGGGNSSRPESNI